MVFVWVEGVYPGFSSGGWLGVWLGFGGGVELVFFGGAVFFFVGVGVFWGWGGWGWGVMAALWKHPVTTFAHPRPLLEF